MFNRSKRVGDRLTLKYHSDRRPSDWIKRKLVITVTRARELVPVVRQQLEDASSGLIRVGEDSLIEKALVRHFAFTLLGGQVLAESLRPANKYYVAKVITGLREIEEGLSGELTLSDLLSPTKWDPHNAYATANLEPLGRGARPNWATCGPRRSRARPDPVSTKTTSNSLWDSSSQRRDSGRMLGHWTPSPRTRRISRASTSNSPVRPWPPAFPGRWRCKPKNATTL